MKQGARLIPTWQMFVVNLQTPWQGRRATEEFLVEPVAKAADRLSQRQSRCHSGEGVEHREPAAARDENADNHARSDSTPDTEAALPDFEHINETTVEAFPVGDHVIDACTNDTGGHGPNRDAARVVSGSPAT